mgnify:CR=1 FL=1
MPKILCNLQTCKFNQTLDIPDSYENKTPIGDIGVYRGLCTKDTIEIVFKIEEVKGTHIIRHKIAECKSYVKIQKGE